MKSKTSEKRTAKSHASQSTTLENGVPSTPPADVMTLGEAAAFLRVDEDVVKQMADESKVPARRVGGDWRFLKSALCAWLSEPEKPPVLTSKEHLLAMAGSCKDDETFDDFMKSVQENRKRWNEAGR